MRPCRQASHGIGVRGSRPDARRAPGSARAPARPGRARARRRAAGRARDDLPGQPAELQGRDVRRGGGPGRVGDPRRRRRERDRRRRRARLERTRRGRRAGTQVPARRARGPARHAGRPAALRRVGARVLPLPLPGHRRAALRRLRRRDRAPRRRRDPFLAGDERAGQPADVPRRPEGLRAPPVGDLAGDPQRRRSRRARRPGVRGPARLPRPAPAQARRPRQLRRRRAEPARERAQRRRRREEVAARARHPAASEGRRG